MIIACASARAFAQSLGKARCSWTGPTPTIDDVSGVARYAGLRDVV